MTTTNTKTTDTTSIELNESNIVREFKDIEKLMTVAEDGTLAITGELTGEEYAVVFNHYDALSAKGKVSTLFAGHLAFQAGVWDEFEAIVKIGRSEQTVYSLKNTCSVIVPALIEAKLPIAGADFIRNVSSVLLLKGKDGSRSVRKGKEVTKLLSAIKSGNQKNIKAESEKAKLALIASGKMDASTRTVKRDTDSVVSAPVKREISDKQHVRLLADHFLSEGLTCALAVLTLNEVFASHKFFASQRVHVEFTTPVKK